MTPRVAVDTAPATATLADVVELLRTSPHSKFPVVGAGRRRRGGRGRRWPSCWRSHGTAGRGTSVAEVCSAAVVVPGSLPLPAVLEQLRSSRRQLAVVVDEFGGFDGVLSLEDIAEEVVGDIFDEGDEPEPEPPTGPADTHTLSARLRLDEVESSTGIRLPLGADYATVSGLVLGQLGRVARTGDTVVIEEVPDPADLDDPAPPDRIEIRVDEVERHVPAVVTLLRHRSEPDAEEQAS